MMNATAKIKREILLEAEKYNPEEFKFGSLDTLEQVNDAYQILRDADEHWEFESEYRSGEVETDLPCDWDRNYESKSVAMQTSDGSWVGWTYWYGGGKHGEPGAIEWMEEAYDLDCIEEERVVKVRTFSKKES